MLLNVNAAALTVFDIVDVDVIIGAVTFIDVAATVNVEAVSPRVPDVLPTTEFPSPAFELIRVVVPVSWITVGVILSVDIVPAAFKELKRISLLTPSIAILCLVSSVPKSLRYSNDIVFGVMKSCIPLVTPTVILTLLVEFVVMSAFISITPLFPAFSFKKSVVPVAPRVKVSPLVPRFTNLFVVSGLPVRVKDPRRMLPSPGAFSSNVIPLFAPSMPVSGVRVTTLLPLIISRSDPAAVFNPATVRLLPVTFSATLPVVCVKAPITSSPFLASTFPLNVT